MKKFDIGQYKNHETHKQKRLGKGNLWIRLETSSNQDWKCGEADVSGKQTFFFRWIE